MIVVTKCMVNFVNTKKDLKGSSIQPPKNIFSE